ncbi:MAG: hypothetical protein KIB43_05355 [Clostridium baratii]|uniref:hypothetical protein n=1 Tax=Clostridium baratii TaxID=1561 RepID=UPI00242B6AD0|nr:hypothetical protein [Clostridium baratii]MBS6006367.1 hypothetical protein [Clostridium baratii]
MKPDKKYMSLTNDDIIFDTFEVESPFCDLNYGLTPIVNIESNTFRTLEPCDEEEDLRKSSIDNALGGNEELMCYNKDVYVDTLDNFEIPTPTEVLRGLDLDLNEDDLVRASLRASQDFDDFEEFDNLEEFDDDIMYDLNNLRVESTPPRPQPGKPPVQPPRPPRPPVEPPRPPRPPVQPPRPPRPPVQPPRPPRPPVQPPRPPRPPVQPPRPPRPPRPCTGEFVFEQIRRNNPNILNTLISFRVPPPIARTLIIRIANLTLQYCNCNTRE